MCKGHTLQIVQLGGSPVVWIFECVKCLERMECYPSSEDLKEMHDSLTIECNLATLEDDRSKEERRADALNFLKSIEDKLNEQEKTEFLNYINTLPDRGGWDGNLETVTKAICPSSLPDK